METNHTFSPITGSKLAFEPGIKLDPPTSITIPLETLKQIDTLLLAVEAPEAVYIPDYVTYLTRVIDSQIATATHIRGKLKRFLSDPT